MRIKNGIQNQENYTSGTCGDRGTDRTDDVYPLRIGRSVGYKLLGGIL